jgi:predicted RNA methylase
MGSYATVQAHRSMVFDDLRNRCYAEAIKRAVGKESVVLDLGAGLGLHGLMAAGCGAQKVYLVEPASILQVGKQLVEANDLSDQVECIAGTIEEVNLPEKVDVIISVFTGKFLLTEDLLPSLFFARDRYLKPGGILVPDRAVMEVAPVCAPEYLCGAHRMLEQRVVWCEPRSGARLCCEYPLLRQAGEQTGALFV